MRMRRRCSAWRSCCTRYSFPPSRETASIATCRSEAGGLGMWGESGYMGGIRVHGGIRVAFFISPTLSDQLDLFGVVSPVACIV